MIKYLIIILLLFSLTAKAQDKEGSLSVNADSRIEKLVDLHIAYNQAFPVMPGYRIQIFMESGNDALNQAEEVKERFEDKYDGVNAYLYFAAPYYRVRIGDFRTRIEAEKFLQRINRTYPNAWVIKDEINFPEISNNQKTIKHE